AAGYAGADSRNAGAPVPVPRVGFAAWCFSRWHGVDSAAPSETARSAYRHDVGRYRFGPASPAPLPAELSGLPFSPSDHLQCLDIQMGFGQQLFQPAVLQFEILEPFGIRHGHATELGAPSVERGITEAMPPAQLLYRHTGLRLLQKVENLFFCKTLFHCRLLLGKRTLLSSVWY